MGTATLVRGRCAAAAVMSIAGAASAQVVSDGSFEAGTPNPSWTEFSTNFGTPLCDPPSCLGGTGTGARTGTWWAWFGGISNAFEQGTVTQSVTIPAGTARLEFYLTAFSQRTDGMDFLSVSMDATEVFRINDQQIAPYTAAYVLVSVPISAFAGGTHTVKFDSITHGSAAAPLLTNFYVDDVTIIAGGGSNCYANCDGSTTTPLLTINDFVCFQAKFAAGDTYANCDGSTIPPTLTVNDFICFQGRFAAGCSAP